MKTESELIAMANPELKVHADCPDGMTISISAMAVQSRPVQVARTTPASLAST